MITYHLTTDFVTPPSNSGQMVTLSYALAADDEVIIVCTDDASDRTTTYTAYAYPDDDDGEWEPWNCAPELGRCLGECWVTCDDTNDDDQEKYT